MKILYFKVSNSTFVNIDRDILVKNFYAKEYYINMQTSVSYLFALLKLTGYLICNGWNWNIYFIRFADWHTAILTFFKKIYGKKLIIVNGGYDVLQVKEIRYGANASKIRSRCIKYSLNNADYLLPNSKSLVESVNSYASNNSVKQGINVLAPNTKAIIKIIPNGFIIPQNDDNLIHEKQMILTVAQINNEKRFRLKGIDCFIEVAKKISHAKFCIAGVSENFFTDHNIIIPHNILVLPELSYYKITQLYKKSKVFCLFSLSEGMPNVLCEAMMYKCIPVGSNVSSIPEIIGNTGYVVYNRNVDEMIDKVNKAWNSPHIMGNLARNRIIDNYSINKREHELVNLIQSI